MGKKKKEEKKQKRRDPEVSTVPIDIEASHKRKGATLAGASIGNDQ